jgi:hypothetical protein
MPDENAPEDFLAKVERSHDLWSPNESWTPEKTVEHFQLFSPAKRVEALQQLDDAVRTADTSSLRKFAKLTRLRTDLENVHKDLSLVNR